MSLIPTYLTDEIFGYIQENFSSDDEFLINLKIEAEKEGLPRICISEEQAAFLQFYLRSINAKYILEVGSLGGYSAITMARALPKGAKLITIEKNEKHYEFSKRKIKESGLEGIINIYNTGALDFIRSYKPWHALDFIFLDADKTEYIEYAKLLLPHLRKGGVISADNAFAFGEIASASPTGSSKEVNAINEFNLFIRNHPQFVSCIVPVGDGMLMGLKVK